MGSEGISGAELREKRREEVEALIVLAAAGMWVITLVLIGLAAITEALNALHELA